jgi:3-hydroxyisobutyrate dehydrogenase
LKKESFMKSFTADQVRLGFIGVGAMGSRIVRRLRDHGYQVTVYNRNRTKAEALLPYSVSVAASLAELGTSADIILSCLSDDDAVRNVYLGKDGILAGSRPGKFVLEMSTVSPKTSRELQAQAAKHGLDVMDVAISGSTPAVEQGTIRLLVGGNAELFRAAEPIFQALTSHYFLMGPSGAGTSMKLVVNALLGVGMQAIAEGVALGEAEGIDRGRLLYVLSQTTVVPPAHLGKLARVEQNDYSPQFGIGLMNKDFRLILNAAKSSNLELPATTAAFEVNSAAFEEDPDADLSSVIRHMGELVQAKV